MKLKSCFLFMCMIPIMLACSGNDDPVDQPKTPIVPDATLALSVGATDKVKANDGTENTVGDGTIRSLVAIVFNAEENGAYQAAGYQVGDIVYTATANITNPGSSATITGLGLASNNEINILLVANLTDNEITEVKSMKSIDEVQSMEVNLKNETEYTADGSNGGLIMSKRENVVLRPGENHLEFLLDRLVARVELNSLTLQSSNEYKSVSFKPTEVFLTNAKSIAFFTDVTAEAFCSIVDGNYSVGDKFYLTGDNTAQNSGFDDGEYKTGKEEYYKNLNASIKDLTVTSGAAIKSEALAAAGNSYFYVYPNTAGETTSSKKNYTLLIVKGDYTHLVDGINRTETNRYYTVVVNDDRFNAGGGEGVDNSHIKRNTKYWIDLTIAGSGSDKPYDPAAFAYVSAKFHVTDWTIKYIQGGVD